MDTMLAGFGVGVGVLLAGVWPVAAEPAVAEPAQATPQLQLGHAPAPAEEEPVVVREWYGAPMVMIDVLAFASLAGATLVAHEHGDLATWLAFAGVGGYLAGGPAYHFFFERRFKMTLASLGTRMGAPIAGMFPGALIGALVGKAYGHGAGDDWGGFIAGLAFGFLGGLVVAAAVDDFAIARKPVGVARPSVAILPVYQPTTRQTGLMLRAIW